MLFELLQRNLHNGLPPQVALASALAERERIERGQPPDAAHAKGTRKERKSRRSQYHQHHAHGDE